MAYERAAEWLDEASHVLVMAGAGISASAGFDYGDRKRFAELFPAFAKSGFSARYQAIGYDGWTPAQKWGYWAIHVDDIRFGERNDPVYRGLRALIGDKSYFVHTSNVDMLFARNGFDEQRLHTPQGDYGYLQCAVACRPVVWDSEPVIKRLLASIDPETQTVNDHTALPKCPHCGGEVFLNVRIDHHFVESAYQHQKVRLNDWLTEAAASKVLIIEIGAGFNTPTVVRLPSEHLATHLPNAKLLRVNKEYPRFPQALVDKAIGIGSDASEAISQLQIHANIAG